MSVQTTDLHDYSSGILIGGRYIKVAEAMGTSLEVEEGTRARVVWRFKVSGADDASVALAALKTYIDQQFGGESYNLPLATTRISTTDNSEVYDAEVVFEEVEQEDFSEESEEYEPPTVEDDDYSFSTGGGSSHISHSYATASYPATGETARDFGGGIGWNGESFDGCDVVTPKVEFSITVSRPKWFLNSTYRRTLANATGSVNSVAWDGYAPRCVLFKGVNARPQRVSGDWYWRIVYSFAAAPAVQLTFGGATVTKAGFDYLWRLTRATEANGELNSEVAQINVERVYPTFDFANLQLPLPE